MEMASREGGEWWSNQVQVEDGQLLWNRILYSTVRDVRPILYTNH